MHHHIDRFRKRNANEIQEFIVVRIRVAIGKPFGEVDGNALVAKAYARKQIGQMRPFFSGRAGFLAQLALRGFQSVLPLEI